MSRSTLACYKSELTREEQFARETTAELKDLDRSLHKAMEDRVGETARQSMRRIESTFTRSMDAGFRQAQQTVQALEQGYGNLDALTRQSDDLLAQAEAIIQELEGS